MGITNRKQTEVADLILDQVYSGPKPSCEVNDGNEMEYIVDLAPNAIGCLMLFDDESTSIACPIDEIDSLQRRHDRLSVTGDVLERPPVACGIVRRIQLLGIFPTTRWLADPTMHPDVKELFGGTPFFALGDYRVAYIDLLDSSGTTHGLIVVLNKGVEGLLTGHWGAIFEKRYPHECWARLEASGENQTSIKAEALVNTRFHEFRCIDFCEDYFETRAVSWICTTQLERILGLAAEFLLGLEWSDRLPEELIESRDRSCRLERKRRARVARKREAVRVAQDENMAPDRGTKNEKPLVETRVFLASRSHEPLNKLLANTPGTG
jgi:hypothetical protein